MINYSWIESKCFSSFSNFALAQARAFSFALISITPPIRSSTAAFDGNRWRASTPVHGIFMGDAITKCQTSGYQGYADDIEFHGNVIPEPSSLLALGGAMLALAGYLRKTRNPKLEARNKSQFSKKQCSKPSDWRICLGFAFSVI